jgi:hypothetical protein
MSEALRTENFSRSELDFVTGKTEPASTVPVVANPQPARARRQTPSATKRTALVTGTHSQNAAATVSMTFRLPADLPAQLIRASAERRVTRELPASQQDIVAEALRDWLRRNTPAI